MIPWLIVTELIHRPRRSLTAVFSVAIGVAIFLGLQAYSTGYRAAAREPLTLIGSDVVAQRQGDRPESFEGVVFPHSTAPVHTDEVDRIRDVPGVSAVAPAMFFWSFQNDELVVALGVDAASGIGPARLATATTSGRFLEPDDQGVAALDASYARTAGLTTGDDVTVAGTTFTVVGTVDTGRAGRIANANVYLPLADAQRLVEAAPSVKAVHDVRQGDVNVLFLRADPAKGPAVADEVEGILGEDALVTTPQSFDRVLGPSFAVIDRFGLAIGLLALVLATAGLLRVVLGGLAQRRRSVAVLRAVGWRRGALRGQLVGESVLLTTAGLAVGVGTAVLVTMALGATEVTIPVPWELSPTPHFVAGGAKDMSMAVPMRAALEPSAIGVVAAVCAAAATLAGLAATRRAAQIKPSEVWRVD